jgi:hypothetical protein
MTNYGWWFMLVILSMFGTLVATLEIDYKHQRRLARSWRRWRNRRCSVSPADALWLTTDLHALDCPCCGRLLAHHRR